MPPTPPADLQQARSTLLESLTRAVEGPRDLHLTHQLGHLSALVVGARSVAELECYARALRVLCPAGHLN